MIALYPGDDTWYPPENGTCYNGTYCNPNYWCYQKNEFSDFCESPFTHTMCGPNHTYYIAFLITCFLINPVFALLTYIIKGISFPLRRIIYSTLRISLLYILIMGIFCFQIAFWAIYSWVSICLGFFLFVVISYLLFSTFFDNKEDTSEGTFNWIAKMVTKKRMDYVEFINRITVLMNNPPVLSIKIKNEVRTEECSLSVSNYKTEIVYDEEIPYMTWEDDSDIKEFPKRGTLLVRLTKDYALDGSLMEKVNVAKEQALLHVSFVVETEPEVEMEINDFETIFIAESEKGLGVIHTIVCSWFGHVILFLFTLIGLDTFAQSLVVLSMRKVNIKIMKKMSDENIYRNSYKGAQNTDGRGNNGFEVDKSRIERDEVKLLVDRHSPYTELASMPLI